MPTKKWGHGAGWWGESDRHSLSARGFKTGTKNPKLGRFSPYDLPFPHIPMQLRIVGKDIVDRRGDEDKVLAYLNASGWRVKPSYDVSGARAYEAQKGMNYVMLVQTHYGKLKAVEAVIIDKDVGVRLKEVLRKPYPYKLPEYAKEDYAKKVPKMTLSEAIEIEKNIGRHHNKYFYTDEELEEAQKVLDDATYKNIKLMDKKSLMR